MIAPPESTNIPALWFIYFNDQILLSPYHPTYSIPELLDITVLDTPVLFSQYMGLWQEKHCYCAEISMPTILPEGWIWQPLRQAAIHILSEDLFRLAGRALQLLHWDKNTQFCSRCGTPVDLSQTEHAKICSRCQMVHYPRISPCVIVLIQRGKEILLARSPHFSPGTYSLLAGFMEPGESAEEAVHREVNEEVGIQIKNLQYRFSQSWPFSDSLMLGFTADYLAGEIIIDGVEIEKAGWFSRENLPSLPTPASIARKLIEHFIHKEF